MGLLANLFGKKKNVEERNSFHIEYKELAGYHYLQTIVIGTFKIKTWKGAAIEIPLKNGKTLELNSDMDEIKSEFVKEYEANATAIDFEITKGQLMKLKDLKIDKVILKFDKKTLEIDKKELAQSSNK